MELQPHHPNCLGCGPQNRNGLRLTVCLDGEEATANANFDRRHEGAPGFVHGGALATAFDEVLGALLAVTATPAVTAELTVSYVLPVPLQRHVSLRAWIERLEARKLFAAAVMTAQSDVLARARAVFVTVSPRHFAERGAHTYGSFAEYAQATGFRPPWTLGP